MNETTLQYVLGIDIGGTNLVVGAVRTDGLQVLGVHSQPTDASRGPDAVIADIITMGEATLRQLRAEVPEADVLGVGVGSPGPLNTTTGIVILTPNLGWVDMPVRDRIAAGLGLRASLDNDANCAVLGECWVGAAQGKRCVVGLTIGTGIGGGIVLEGRLHHGASDCAAEVGHMTINLNGRRCGCGNDGCLEAYASGPAIAARAVEQLRAGAESTLSTLVDGALDRVTAATVYEAAAAGDELANEVVRDTALYLGVGVANLVNIFNPDCVVIAGGVTAAGDHLLVPLRREVARRAFRPAVEACTIVPAALGNHAGVIGAARVFMLHHADEVR